ncbi:MAG: DUF2484 family protein [Brevirhabdus sp.]
MSLVAALLWMVLANALAMLPSRRNHWPQAYLLMALGAPILIGVFVQNGVWTGIIVLIAMMSMLRWPVIYFARWVRRVSGM